MDKFFSSTFDFFAHALPGMFMVFSFFILDPNLNTAHDFFTRMEAYGLHTIVFFLVVGYAAGFAVYPLGRFFYRETSKKLWKTGVYTRYESNPAFISDKFVLVRELSPANFKYIEAWHMFSSMSHGLGTALLVTFINAMIKIRWMQPPNPDFWFVVAIATLAMFFLLVHRAVVFDRWAADDLNAAIRVLNLEKRVQNLQEKKD